MRGFLKCSRYKEMHRPISVKIPETKQINNITVPMDKKMYLF